MKRGTKRIKNWYQEVSRHILTNEPIKVKMCTLRTEANIRNNNIKTMKQWIFNAKEMYEKVERLPQGDI